MTQMTGIAIINVLEFCHEKIRTLIPDNFPKICETRNLRLNPFSNAVSRNTRDFRSGLFRKVRHQQRRQVPQENADNC